ncbi:MAG: HAD family hydrolase [Proteobacteria bacterium]|nr:HAD family hydrolase [Pseudomonadota bacterium]
MDIKQFLAELNDRLSEHYQAIHELDSQPGKTSSEYVKGFGDAFQILRRLTQDLAHEWSAEGIYAHPPHPHPRSRTYRSEPPDWLIEDTQSSSLKSFIAAKANDLPAGSTGAVIFDLDGTLFDVGHRTLGILKKWLSLPESRHYAKSLVKRVEGINFNHIGYSLAHAFENAGLDLRNPDVMEILLASERYWRRKFFDGETLLEFDQVYSGAVEFVWFCRKLGLKIVYLTGRSQKVMANGTRRQLEKYGFPVEDAELVLKLNTVTDDAVFKEEAFRAVSLQHAVVGNFENEYVNIRGMVQANPHAVHVIVDSQHSGRPVRPMSEKVYRIQSFTD